MIDATEDLARKETKLKDIEEDIEESEKQNSRLYKVVKENKKTITNNEIEEEHMNKEVHNLRSNRNRVSGDVEEQTSVLEETLSTLQLQNREMR